jgi:hydroxymethylbilane synthase
LNNQKIIIGSRGSKLAIWQANYVKDQLNNIGTDCEIKIIKTKGDRIQNLSFDKIEGKGFFTKEIENELINKSIDLAVHSLKDLETNQPKGLSIGAIPLRENPSDVLLINAQAVDKTQPLSLIPNAIVGTSSARRKNQLLFFRNDLIPNDLRGNVPTRVEKLRLGKYDAIVLAKAGLNRLEIDLSDFFVYDLSPSLFISAPAQGALGLQIRETDTFLKNILSFLNDKSTLENVSFEREILNKAGGGCHSPFGAFSKIDSKGNRITWVSSAENIEDVPFRFVTNSIDTSSIVDRMKKKNYSKKYLDLQKPK